MANNADNGGPQSIAARTHSMIVRILSSRPLRSSGIYLGGNVLAAVFPLLMLPIFTRWLNPAEYGVYALALVLVQFLFPIASLGLSNAIARDFVDRHKLDFARVVSISLVLSAAVVVVIALVAVLAQYLGIDVLLGEEEELSQLFIPVVIIMLVGQLTISIAMSLQQMEERPVLYSVFRIGAQLLFALFALIALVGMEAGLNGLIISKGLADGLVVIACIAYLKRRGYLVARFQRKEAGRLLAYGLPLVPHMISVSLIAIIDRTLLAHMVGVSATGIFMAGYQVGMVMWLVVSSTNAAWVPWFYKQMAENTPEAHRSVVLGIYGIIGLYALLALLLVVIMPLAVTILIDQSYHGAVPVAQLVIVAFLFQGGYAIFSSFLYYQKRTTSLSLATMGTLAVNLIASYMAISAFGMVGAAVGTIIAYLTSFIVVAVMAIRGTELPWFGFARVT